jgi:hypothetical protein
MAGYAIAGAVPPAQVDACKLIDVNAANAAAKVWFGTAITFTGSSATGVRGGTCDFSTDSPKHIDFSVFYAPVGNPDFYGLGASRPPNETPVSGVGDRAVYDETNDAGSRYKNKDFAVLKGKAVLVISVTLDKSVPFVTKEKLAEFAAKQFVPKM